MLACADPPPAQPPDEERLLAERAQLIALLRQVDELQRPAGLREWLVAQIRRIDEHIREARRQQNTPPEK